jgi:hypothetical protein
MRLILFYCRAMARFFYDLLPFCLMLPISIIAFAAARAPFSALRENSFFDIACPRHRSLCSFRYYYYFAVTRPPLMPTAVCFSPRHAYPDRVFQPTHGAQPGRSTPAANGDDVTHAPAVLSAAHAGSEHSATMSSRPACGKHATHRQRAVSAQRAVPVIPKGV